MLAVNLIQTSFPNLALGDKSSFALQLMDDYDVTHLPVINDGKFVGMVTKEDLLDIDENAVIANVEENFIVKYVLENEHFLTLVKIATDNELDIVPVLSVQQEMLGCVNTHQLLATLNHFVGNDEPGGVIVLEMDRRNFSFGELSRLVETNDAYVTQLNTSVDTNTGLLYATIKVNKIEISDIVATFQRYDYNVQYFFGEEQYANELKDNYNHLMSYLNM